MFQPIGCTKETQRQQIWGGRTCHWQTLDTLWAQNTEVTTEWSIQLQTSWPFLSLKIKAQPETKESVYWIHHAQCYTVWSERGQPHATQLLIWRTHVSMVCNKQPMCPSEGSLLLWVCQRSNMCYETTIFAVLIVEWHLIWTIPAHQLLILFDNKTHCFAHYRFHHHTHYCLNNINQMLILKLFTFHLHFILCMPDGAYRCISCHTGVALLVCWIVKRNYTHRGSGRQAVVEVSGEVGRVTYLACIYV